MKLATCRVSRLAVLALMSVALTLPACAGAYDQCVKPEITAASKLAPAELAKVVEAFLMCGGISSPGMAAPCAVDGLAQLAVAIGPGGEQAVNCLIAYFMKNGATPELKAAAKKVGAKRGVTEGDLVSCRGLQMRGPHAPDASIGRRTDGSTALLKAPGDVRGRGVTLSSCDVACGHVRAGLLTPSTPSGCSCWRASRTDWRSSRWVALAGSPPGEAGLGVAGGGGG